MPHAVLQLRSPCVTDLVRLNISDSQRLIDADAGPLRAFGRFVATGKRAKPGVFIWADLCQNRFHITRRGLIGMSTSIASSAASVNKPSAMHLVGRSAAAPTVAIRVMSGFQLLHDGVELQLPETGERVLAVLAVKGRPLPRLKLSAMFWPDAGEKQALANLRSALWRLSGPSHAALDIRPRSLGLAASVRVDLRTSEALAHQILDRTSVLTEDQLVAAAAHLQEDLLAGWYDDWAVQESERWRQLRVHALEAAARRLGECGSYAAALDTALLAVEVDPVRESAHTEVIKIHLAEHNHSEVIRAFDRCCSVLREELGLEPSEYLRSLVRSSTGW